MPASSLKPTRHVPQFKGLAHSVEELLASIKGGQFTLDGRHLVVPHNLDVIGYQLTSLIGCPQVVMGGFDCSWNKLRTLEGMPAKLGGYFFCVNNVLYDLKGSPRHVKGNFCCDGNPLLTLKGGPTQVDGNYSCLRVALLKSLEGCAEVIGGNLLFDTEHLTSFKGGPRLVKGNVVLMRAFKLVSLEDIHLHLPEVHGSLELLGAPLKEKVLGLLKINGLKSVKLDNKRLEAILNRYLPEGNLLACALELVEAGFEEQTRL